MKYEKYFDVNRKIQFVVDSFFDVLDEKWFDLDMVQFLASSLANFQIFFVRRYTLSPSFSKGAIFLFLFWYVVEFLCIFKIFSCIAFIVFPFVIVAFVDTWFLDSSKRFGSLPKFAKNDVTFVVFETLTFKVNYVIDKNFTQLN